MDVSVTYGIVRPDRSWQCFSTEAEALRAASNGRINLAGNETINSLSLTQLEQIGVNTILCQLDKCEGVWWLFVNYSCGSQRDIPSFFQKRTSSLIAGRCGVTLYQERNLGGHSKYFPLVAGRQ